MTNASSFTSKYTSFCKLYMEHTTYDRKGNNDAFDFFPFHIKDQPKHNPIIFYFERLSKRRSFSVVDTSKYLSLLSLFYINVSLSCLFHPSRGSVSSVLCSQVYLLVKVLFQIWLLLCNFPVSVEWFYAQY